MHNASKVTVRKLIITLSLRNYTTKVDVSNVKIDTIIKYIVSDKCLTVCFSPRGWCKSSPEPWYEQNQITRHLDLIPAVFPYNVNADRPSSKAARFQDIWPKPKYLKVWCVKANQIQVWGNKSTGAITGQVWKLLLLLGPFYSYDN